MIGSSEIETKEGEAVCCKCTTSYERGSTDVEMRTCYARKNAEDDELGKPGVALIVVECLVADCGDDPGYGCDNDDANHHGHCIYGDGGENLACYLETLSGRLIWTTIILYLPRSRSLHIPARR